MMLRLIASVSPRLSPGHAGRGLPLAARIPPVLPGDTLKGGAIRLSFAAWRLSLPLSRPPHGHLDDKIA